MMMNARAPKATPKRQHRGSWKFDAEE
jgi:hypothetical protein